MIGHLLLLSSASDIARRKPTTRTLILLGLDHRKMPAIVASRTRCGPLDTAGAARLKQTLKKKGV
jgi:hypothetical protein